MPVLVEGACVLVRQASLAAAAPAGAPELGARARASCSDGALACFAFPDARTLSRAISAFAARGLWEERDDELVDCAVVSTEGFLWPSHLIELGTVELAPGEPVRAARLAGSEGLTVACPPGFRWLESSFDAIGLPALRLAERPLVHLGREARGDRYRDRFTGEELLLARRRPPAGLRLRAQGGREHALVAEQCATPEEIELGLMFRDRLDDAAGMLFDFGRPGPRSFWMRNTWVALDLLFLDGAGRVVGLHERAAPRTLTRRPCRRPARWVLEVQGGLCAALGLGPGDVVLRTDGAPLASLSALSE